ncbi:MAG TPA: M48 family metallopeptidase [Chitinophagaceae bacterium]|nr:M48 family metallopeptidase [Chitinophagaceae bacterium]HPG12707.1 M48 family metallopeptidase [Chitinophagaceae bacterium]
MQYVGIDRQIRKNNFNSLLLLITFPVLLLGMCYAFVYLAADKQNEDPQALFLRIFPFVLIAVGIWFFIAWMGNAAMIRMATGSKPLERRDNKRVYNLLENLCISQGMQMPKLYIIEDDSLNAFASGIDQRSFSISLSRGIIEKLEDDELEGVLAHELTHIKNRDVRVLIISIIFVGIFAFLAEMAFRSLRFAGSGRRSKNDKGSGAAILIAIVVTAIAYFISILLRFGISRKREYLADAGGADMTKKPYALASALRKIAGDPAIEAVESRDVAQLFIDNPTPSSHRSASWDNLFATHPPIEKRIELLEQFA